MGLFSRKKKKEEGKQESRSVAAVYTIGFPIIVKQFSKASGNYDTWYSRDGAAPYLYDEAREIICEVFNDEYPSKNIPQFLGPIGDRVIRLEMTITDDAMAMVDISTDAFLTEEEQDALLEEMSDQMSERWGDWEHLLDIVDGEDIKAVLWAREGWDICYYD